MKDESAQRQCTDIELNVHFFDKWDLVMVCLTIYFDFILFLSILIFFFG